MTIATPLFKTRRWTAMGCRTRALRSAFVLVGWSLSLSTFTESAEWVETFDDSTSLDCKSPGQDGAPCWQFYRENGSGSYFVQDGKLLATFGPCPHNGRSLYFGLPAVLRGDVTVDVEARLPDEGQLMVFAHGDNRSSGYRGILQPTGQLELFRVEYTGQVLLATTSLRDMSRYLTVHLELQVTGDQLFLEVWRSGSIDRTPQLRVADSMYRTGRAGAGIRHPGYGEYGEFESIRIAQTSEPELTKDSMDTRFIRGDSNGDGAVDASDAVSVLSWLFSSANTPECLAAANTNGDDGVNLADPVMLLGFLFAEGPAPAAPFPECGVHGSYGDDIECVESQNCS